MTLTGSHTVTIDDDEKLIGPDGHPIIFGVQWDKESKKFSPFVIKEFHICSFYSYLVAIISDLHEHTHGH